MSNNYKSENKLCCVQLKRLKDLENQRTRLQERIQECLERRRNFSSRMEEVKSQSQRKVKVSFGEQIAENQAVLAQWEQRDQRNKDASR